MNEGVWKRRFAQNCVKWVQCRSFEDSATVVVAIAEVVDAFIQIQHVADAAIGKQIAEELARAQDGATELLSTRRSMSLLANGPQSARSGHRSR